MIYLITFLIASNLALGYLALRNFYVRKVTENEAVDLYDDFDKYKKENEKKDEELVRLTLENNRLTSQLKCKCDKKCKKK